VAGIKVELVLSAIDHTLSSSCERLGLSQLSITVWTKHAQQMEGSMLGLILLVVLILFLVGALPTWPHSRNWGYFPSGGIGLILVIVVILLLLGQI
jgi:hypothetical protein